MTKIAQIANFYGPRSGGLKTSMIELAKQYNYYEIKFLLSFSFLYILTFDKN